MPKMIRLSSIVYGYLLMAYSREFRLRFGVELADVFEQLVRDAVREEGFRGLGLVWRTALWEVVTLAAPSRLSSCNAIAAALSLLASSVLFLAFFRAIS